MSDADQIVILLKLRNPYPADVFHPLTDKEIKRYVKLLTDNGFSSDKIHAHWMRYAWNNAGTELAKILEEDRFYVGRK